MTKTLAIDREGVDALISALIERGYFGADEFLANQCKFNIYYHPGAGDYREVCSAWDVPDDFAEDCSFADSTAIIFNDPLRACAGGSRFSTRRGAL